MAGRIETVDFSANPYSTIIKLAAPSVIAMLAQSAVNEIDIVFFKMLETPEDSNSQAALLPSLIVVWLFGGSLSAISVGTQALTARRFAEGDRKGAGAVLTNAVFFSLAAGITFSVLGYFLLPTILGSMIGHENAPVLDIATRYSRWRLLGVTSMAMTMGVKSFFDGIGRTTVHLVASVVMNILNVLLCWLLIFGNLGFPKMGAEGAGVSAFVATWVGLGIMLAYSFGIDAGRTSDDDPSRFTLYRREMLSRPLINSILRLSIPAALATVVMMLGFGLFSKVVGQLDATIAAQAGASAHASAGGHHESVNSAATTDIVLVLKLTFTACIAFGTATATLVAQSLGAKRPADAVRYGWASVRLGLVVFGLVGLLEGVFFTHPILNLITDSEKVHAAAVIPMRMMGCITPIIAVAMILSEALFGAGNPKFVAVVQFLLVFGCLVPVAFVLGVKMGLGLVGIWLAACVYSLCAAIAMTLKFHGGKWKDITL